MTKPTRADAVRESIMHKEQTKAKPKTKAERSQFEQVLKDRARQIQQPSLIRQSVTQQATRQATRHVKRHEERGREREKGKDKGEEREGRKGTESDRKTDAKTAEQRVISKKGLTDDRGGSRGGGGRGGSDGQRRSSSVKSRFASGRQGPSMLKAQFAKKLTAALKEPSSAFSQRILNQIISQVRILMNSDQEKEILIDLHERIFKGLKLRVVSKGKGKVAVHFTTANSAMRELFEDNRERIEGALGRRGIEVDEISVT